MVNAWNNNDGLYLKFGTSKATVEVAGEYRNNGDERVLSVLLDLTTLGTAAAIISDNSRVPGYAQVTEVKVITQTAGTGTGAVLNLGLIRADRSTEVDYDGLIAALPLTSMDAAGETTTLVVGSTYAGALIGAVPASTQRTGMYLTADYDTAAFTAGVVLIQIKYRTYGTILD